MILRELGLKLAEIATLPIQAEKKEMWRALNNLSGKIHESDDVDCGSMRGIGFA